METNLNKPLLPSRPADEEDVRDMKITLNRLGYYMPTYNDLGINDIPDRTMFDGLRSFQKDAGLHATGTAKPGDGTVAALNNAVSSQSPDAMYIWHTVEDDKVRPSHAARDGLTFSWADSPVPGEEYGCRCWAVNLPNDPPIKPVYPDLYLLGGLFGGEISGPLWSALQTIIKSGDDDDNPLTSHGQERAAERNINDNDVQEAIKTAQQNNKVITKIGKYGTEQKVYEGANGVTVVVETEGRNAGKIITMWRN